MRSFADLASFPFTAAKGGQLRGDLLLHSYRLVQLVGGAEEVKWHLRFEGQSGRARLSAQHHLWALWVVGWCHGQTAAH